MHLPPDLDAKGKSSELFSSFKLFELGSCSGVFVNPFDPLVNVYQKDEKFLLIYGSVPQRIDDIFELDIHQIPRELDGHYFIIYSCFESVYFITDPVASLPVYIHDCNSSFFISSSIFNILFNRSEKVWRVNFTQILNFVIDSSCSGVNSFFNDITLLQPASQYLFSRSNNVFSVVLLIPRLMLT